MGVGLERLVRSGCRAVGVRAGQSGGSGGRAATPRNLNCAETGAHLVREGQGSSQAWHS